MFRSEPCIPGTEPVTDRVLAERRAALPLKPKVPQRPCDHGLFSDDHAQLDLPMLSVRSAYARCCPKTVI